MKHKTISSTLFLLFFLFTVCFGANSHAGIPSQEQEGTRLLKARIPAVKPALITVPDAGVHKDLIIVKFVEGSDVRLRENRFVSTNTADLVQPSLSDLNVLFFIKDVKTIERHFTRSEEALDAEKQMGERLRLEQLADLNLYYRVWLNAGTNPEPLLVMLNTSEIVEIAYLAPIAELAQLDTQLTEAATPNLQGSQAYLNNTSTGVHAGAAWQKPGGTGVGTKIIDIEFGWQTTHEDLLSPFTPVDGYNTTKFNERNHGTAVLGEMVARDNGSGVTGISYGAAYSAVSVESYSVSDAINRGASKLSAGDILLIELHAAGPDSGLSCECNCSQFEYVPMEYFPDVFDAIKAATSAGKIVVEAAGNGSMNLDSSIYNGSFDTKQKDSGAILVGAGVSTSRDPHCYSNHGTRVDLSGWGDSVVTTGYGDIFNGGSPDRYYTSTFSGTSSASPIVAGSAASLQGIYRTAKSGSVLTPGAMRALLRYKATAQGSGGSWGTRLIGPLPNIEASANFVTASTCSFVVGEGAAGTELQAFQTAYDNAGGTGVLGCPTGPVGTDGFNSYANTKAHYQNFTNGAIEHHINGTRAGQTFVVLNPLFNKWKSLGFTASNPLGYPISNISGQNTSCYGTTYKYQEFEGGALEYNLSGSRSGSVFEIHGAIYTKWKNKGFSVCPLGLPIGDERAAAASGAGTGKTGKVSDLEGGHIHWWNGALTAYESHGSIDSLYAAMGGTGSWLGFPTSDEYHASTGYARSDFEAGYISTVDGINYQAFSYNSETVSIPSKPLGPSSGNTGTTYTYTAGGSSSSLGHSIQYLINWGDGANSGWLPAGTTTSTKSWSATGTYSVTVKARCASHTSISSSDSPSLQVSISSACSSDSAFDWKGDYYQGTAFNQFIFSKSNAKPSGPGSWSDWGSNSPYPGCIPADGFSARWTKSVYFNSGQYRFTVGSDDGARLYIDGVLQGSGCNAWADRAYTESTCDVTFPSSGNREIRFEFYENGGGATAKIDWIITAETVSTPGTPSGSGSGNTGTTDTYTTGGSTSSLGHFIQYFFEWGDGSNSGWLPIGTTSASKSWAIGGTYSVTAKSRCSTHTTVISSSSGSKQVMIGSSGVPTIKVTRPNGGESWKRGTTQKITWASSSLSQSGSIYVFYWINNSWKQIAGPLPATSSSFNWLIPNTRTTSTFVWVGNLVNGLWEISDQSDASFAIR